MAQFTSHCKDDVLVIVYSGKFEGNHDQLVREHFEHVGSSGCERVLVDIRGLEGRLSFGGTYFMAQDLTRNERRKGRTAIVENIKNESYAAFHQLAMRNVGFNNIETFFDYDEAMRWLKDGPATTQIQGG